MTRSGGRTRTARAAAARRRRRKTQLIAGAIAVVVVVLGVGISLVFAGSRTTQAPRVAGTSSSVPVPPNAYRSWHSPVALRPLADRRRDPQPLTDTEVFPASLAHQGLTLQLAAKQVDNDCRAALWGAGLLREVASSGCTQVLRGLYVTADQRYVGQYTLLNLKDAKTADLVVSRMRTLYQSGWVQPLAGGGPSLARAGYSEGSGHALGHFAALVWLGRADGAEPQKGEDFIAVGLGLRGAEKALFRRAAALSGTPSPTGS